MRACRRRWLLSTLRLHAIPFRGASDIASFEIETAGVTDHRSRGRTTPERSAFCTAIAKEKMRSAVFNFGKDRGHPVETHLQECPRNVMSFWLPGDVLSLVISLCPIH